MITFLLAQLNPRNASKLILLNEGDHAVSPKVAQDRLLLGVIAQQAFSVLEAEHTGSLVGDDGHANSFDFLVRRS